MHFAQLRDLVPAADLAHPETAVDPIAVFRIKNKCNSRRAEAGGVGW
jgi:hypothetical protein